MPGLREADRPQGHGDERHGRRAQPAHPHRRSVRHRDRADDDARAARRRGQGGRRVDDAVRQGRRRRRRGAERAAAQHRQRRGPAPHPARRAHGRLHRIRRRAAPAASMSSGCSSRWASLSDMRPEGGAGERRARRRQGGARRGRDRAAAGERAAPGPVGPLRRHAARGRAELDRLCRRAEPRGAEQGLRAHADVDLRRSRASSRY